MIHVLINTLAEKMNEFLSSYYERAEIIVEAGSIDATPNEDQSDKIILSIVNIERETAMGISAPYRNTKNNTFQQTSPPWYLNIYIMTKMTKTFHGIMNTKKSITTRHTSS